MQDVDCLTPAELARPSLPCEPVATSFVTPAGHRIEYETRGEGPALVLVHGAFSDHRSNWTYVMPLLERSFTVHAVARRGRGASDRTEGHNREDESADVASLIDRLDEPVFLLGHSYGALVALGAAAMVPDRVRKLVLYEPPWPSLVGGGVLDKLEVLARAGDWDGLSRTFFGDALAVPPVVLDELCRSDDWAPIIADAPASLSDLRALARYRFDSNAYRALRMPVMLQIGTESPGELYLTDSLSAVLADVVVNALPGQAHEGMTTAPALYADAVCRFLLS